MTGKMLEWEKEMSDSRVRRTVRTLGKIGGLLARHKFKVMLIVVIIVCKMGLALTTPLTFAKLIDLVFEGLIRPIYDDSRHFYMDWVKLGNVGVTLTLKFIAGYVLVFFHKYLVGIVVAAIILSLKNDLKAKMDSFSFWKDNAKRKSELSEKIQKDLDQVGAGIEKGWTTLIAAFVTFTGALLIMFYHHWHIATIAVASTLLALVILFVLKLKKSQSGFWQTVLCWKTFKYFLWVEIGVVALSFLSGKVSPGKIQMFFSYEKKMTEQLEKKQALQQSWQAIKSARHAYEVLEEVK